MITIYRRFCKNLRYILYIRSMSESNDKSTAVSDNNANNEKLIYPAANRNKEPILQVLKRFIICDFDEIEDESPLFVEISSGSGQHVAHFAPHFPGVKFQPTEFDKSLFGSISIYASSCPTKNILQPILVDISTPLSHFGFLENTIDYMYNANMIHISPYECTIGLFENAGKYLKPEALLITYGPYAKDGKISPQSNVEFDASLKYRNPLWGLRDINDLIKLGDQNDLCLIDTVEMPSNNLTLIWKKN
ncbi:methyltransferase-like 26 [Aricia agestis]|uniref:methyltransferase-like 26 n=1 Tax=Aricia agestis TaxID=91739 RepID=UPI001C20AD02|nr:methyltransferase-like 26 [Aricia agestis]